MARLRLLVVGGVAAGTSAAAKARRCDEDAEIILFEQGSDISYATCGLPYHLSQVIPKRKNLLITSEELFDKRLKVDVRTRREVVGIDRAGHKVYVKNLATGKTVEERYDRLVLATGSEPVIPPIQGIDLPFVFSLKTLYDLDGILNFIKGNEPKNAIVIGGGLIGVETGENLAARGLNVSIVEAMPHMLTFLDKEMAAIAGCHAQEKGIRFFPGERVVSIETKDGHGLIRTDCGNELPADIVILSIGVRPNTRLARAAGLAIGKTGAILVDEFMQTSDRVY
ncbi:MAG: FAD-dependent oxidoreductase [Pseudomonadota bacterium]